MLVGLHVPTNLQMYRQIFKCTDKTPKNHYWGGGGGQLPPPPAPPLATLMHSNCFRECYRLAECSLKSDNYCVKCNEISLQEIIIIIIANFYMRFSHEAQSAYSVLLPRSLDTFQCRTYSAQFPLHREHSLPGIATYNGAGKFKHNNLSPPIPGPHLYTWVASSNVDKLPCWRTKVPRRWWDSNPGFQRESRVNTPLYHDTSTNANAKTKKKNQFE